MLFAYRVAKELGHYNVDAMLASAPAGQLNKWQEFYECEPFGEGWLQASTVAAAVANEIRIVASGFSDQKLDVDDLLEQATFVPGYQDKRKEEDIRRQEEACDGIEGL